MVNCPECNNQVPEGENFCPNCGAKQIQKVFCPECGKETDSTTAFCPECGTAIAGKEAGAKVKKEKSDIKMPAVKMPKVSPKMLKIGGIAVAALVVIFIAVSLFSGKGAANNIIYLQDDAVVYTDLDKKETTEVTSRLTSGNMSQTDASAATMMTGLSEDGNTLFFPDRMENYAKDGFTIYYKNLNDKKAEAVKIDSDILQYSVNEKANLVTYIKGSSFTLYQSDLTDKEKIDTDVVFFRASDDGSKIIYMTDEGNFYVKNAGADKEKIDSDASYYGASEDLKTVYYNKNGALYQKTEGADKVKLDSDVIYVNGDYTTGEFYYIKSDEIPVNYLDYLTDTKQAEDNAAAGTILTAPKQKDFETYEQYTAARTEYNEEVSKLSAINSRIKMREELKNWDFELILNTVYYYNGKEAVMVTDSYNMGYYDFVSKAKDAATAIYYGYAKLEAGDKDDISKYTSAYDVRSSINTAIFEAPISLVIVGDKIVYTADDEIAGWRMNTAGDTLFHVEVSDYESNHGDLYKLSISKGVASEPELYDSDVYNGYMNFFSDGRFYYMKDMHENVGELLIDKEKVSYDVDAGTAAYLKDLDAVVYSTDTDEDGVGTLNIYAKKESKKIADDVYNWVLTRDNKLLYLYDYNVKRSVGELYIYDGSEENTMISDDAMGLIATKNKLTNRGQGYFDLGSSAGAGATPY